MLGRGLGLGRPASGEGPRAALRDGWRAYWPVVLLVALPVALFTVPAATGHLLITEDDLIQNYPLRVLVGQSLRHGHLPLWDPYLWSGTPLLAGFNAGALYPLTLLFAVLPPYAAWATTQVVVYAVGGVGMWAFLRRCQVSVLAALLGALTFTYAGAMGAQLVHIDTVEGACVLPWMLLALHSLATRPPAEWRRWALVLGAGYALVVLAGSPEAMLDEAVLLTVYALGLVWHHRARWRPLALGIAVAVALALLLGAAQWLPGLAWIAQSQRAQTSYAFANAGSLAPQIGILSVVPFVLGGYGHFGIPTYFGTYNLPELTSYVGIVPLIAALAMVGRGRRHPPAASEWRVWYLVIIVGVVLSLGRYTPVSHLLAHLPLYGHQRLPSRNLLDVDLGLAVLFAFWVDGVRRPEWRGGAGRRRWEMAVATFPAIVAAGALVAFVLVRGGLVRTLEGSLPIPGSVPAEIGYLAGTLMVTAVGGTIAVLAGRSATRRWWVRALTIFVLFDLAGFLANQYWWSPAPAAVVADSAPLGQALARAASGARFAIYDPGLFDYTDLAALGEPDLNILHQLPSVQGYGSLVSGRYDQATASHDKSTLSPAALAGTTFDQLDLRALATLPAYFLQPLPGTAGPFALTGGTAAVPLAPLTPGQAGQAVIQAGAHQSWFLGTALQVTGIGVGFGAHSPAGPGEAGSVRLGLVTPAGATDWLGSVPTGDRTGSTVLPLPHLATAVGVAVANDARAPLALTGVTVTTTSGAFRLAGALHDAVTPPHWRFDGTHGQWGFFLDTAARGWVWSQAGGGPAGAGGRPARASVRVLGGAPGGPQRLEVVAAKPVLVVRSVSQAPGWSARVQAPNAPAVSTSVLSVGLLQGVQVPAGRHVVSFVYQSPRLGLGLGLSGLGLALAAALAAWELVRGRRRGERSDRGERGERGERRGQSPSKAAPGPGGPNASSPTNQSTREAKVPWQPVR